MRLASLIALLALPTLAQTVTIQAGSPTDQYFVDGVGAWAVPLAAPLSFLRYGVTFRYEIPNLATGFYNVAVVMTEPNKTGAYQRRFTVTVNGQISAPLDLFALTGGMNRPYTLPVLTYVNAGVLIVSFTGILGNAVVSEIVVAPVSSVTGGPCTPPVAGVTIYAQLPDKSCMPLVPIPAPGNTAQIITATSNMTAMVGQPSQIIQVFFVAFTPGGDSTPAMIVRPDVLLEWVTCNAPDVPAQPPRLRSSCIGEERLKILRADGSLAYRYATPAPALLPSSPWNDVK